jgi:formylglycine-generating enzyme required for sulfatase activity
MKRLLAAVCALALAGGSVLVASAIPKHAWKPAPAQLEAARKIGKPVSLTNSIGMKFVLIPAGSFMMGSPPTELEREYHEGPRHRVVISRPFYLQTTEVTQAQYRKIMSQNPSRFQGCDQCPVERVLYDDAREFIRRLNAREKTNRYRLPTEAEWEYACRAGTTTPFSFGATISPDQANYNGHVAYGPGRKGVWRKKTTPAGSFPPNGWGLHDMHGNVWEWCRDWWGEHYYSHSPTRDPQGSSTDDYRVLRGGAWESVPEALRSAHRNPVPPDIPSSGNGFRVVRMP